MGVASEQQKRGYPRKIAVGGIITAFSVVLLWLTSVFVFNKLLILAIDTMLIAIVVIEIDRKTAWIVYSACSIIGAILVSNKLIMLYYITLFGNYAIIKQWTETLRKKIWTHCLKIVYFNGMFIIIMIAIPLLTGISFENIIDINTLLAKISNVQLSVQVNIVIIVAMYQIIWVIGDWVLSLMIEWYYQRLYKKIL